MRSIKYVNGKRFMGSSYLFSKVVLIIIIKKLLLRLQVLTLIKNSSFMWLKIKIYYVTTQKYYLYYLNNFDKDNKDLTIVSLFYFRKIL